MLSSTRNIYRQTFADPGNILLKKSLVSTFASSEDRTDEDEMLLIQPRKRSRAIPDTNNHATSHPASWQAQINEASLDARFSIDAGPFESVTSMQSRSRTLSKTAIADLTLEELQKLSGIIEERIQIKKRFNSTPLRRIIARQASRHASSSTAPTTVEPGSYTASETDTLVNTSTPDSVISDREPIEVRRNRYNDTPLRRIIARQAPMMEQEELGRPVQASAQSRFEPEPQEARRARYNDTPLRRIVYRQTSSSSSLSTASVSTNKPVPRSNTPLRRILSRQVSAQTVPRKEDDNASDRADSVIDADSPIRSRTTAQTTSVVLNDEARIRVYEMDIWNLKSRARPVTPTSSSPSFGAEALRGRVALNDEARIRVWEEEVWAKTTVPPSFSEKKEKTKGTTVTVTEVVVETEKPTRIVVDSKGSPLRRILQRQTSKDWQATARVGVV
jgi:hypothetical protein